MKKHLFDEINSFLIFILLGAHLRARCVHFCGPQKNAKNDAFFAYGSKKCARAKIISRNEFLIKIDAFPYPKRPKRIKTRWDEAISIWAIPVFFCKKKPGYRRNQIYPWTNMTVFCSYALKKIKNWKFTKAKLNNFLFSIFS